MNYEKLLNKLQSTADLVFDEIGGGLFHYGIKESQQQQHYERTPQIHVDPFNDVLNTEKGTSAVRVLIGFFDKDKADSSAYESAGIQFAMEQVSNLYFSKLTDEDLFSELVINRTYLHHYTHTQLTGIVCDFTVVIPADLC